MRLCKHVKFNMIIAILLCMAFVVNIGATFASINYTFNATSVNIATPSVDKHTFIEYASVEGAQGSFEYSPGVTNNQLSVNYGFASGVKYDLMIEFTATYTDTENNNGSNIHLINDFDINFVNRDMWCVDMGSITGWVTQDEQLVSDNKKYYLTGAGAEENGRAEQLTGVMYYMDTISGSASLPIISGVTFHTSPNNSYVYFGDKLTITLNPIYVKSNANNYNSGHAFASNAIDADAFTNWYQYMSVKSGNVVDGWSTKTMIYNAYVDKYRTLEFPHDESIMTTQTTTVGEQQVTKKVVNSSPDTPHPNYSNTAHRYEIVDSKTVFDAITAGNRYNGGLGVYVIPDSDLLTISVSFSYNWYNWETGQMAGTTSSLMVQREFSDEIQTISTSKGNYRYYRGTINKPMYIDILKYIRLTAEDNETIITGEYSLVLSDISVGLITNTNKASELQQDQRDESYNWTGTYVRPSYEIHNSTLTSPVLVRAKDVVGDTEKYDTDISITNNGETPIRISGFTIYSKLWYGYYKNASSTFEERTMGDGYLLEEDAETGASSLKYDTTLWQISNYSEGVFTFGLVSGESVYIPSGYSLNLINGIEVPTTSQCVDGTEANDFWCTLEVSFDTETATTLYTDMGTDVDYSKTNSTSIEVVTEGYYTAIDTGTHGKIYIHNNTRQVITDVNLTNLKVYILDDESTMMTRDKATANTAAYNMIDHLSGAKEIAPGQTSRLSENISIKPGEMVLAYTIVPTTANEQSIIGSFDISATLETVVDNQSSQYIEENSDIDLVYSETTSLGELINNSNNYYEFRLVSTTDLIDNNTSATVLYNSNDFIEKEISQTEYHYYYKGVICPHRSIKMFTAFVPNVTVDYLTHNANRDSSHYVVGNYSTTWGFVEEVDEYDDWLNIMKNLYDAPTLDERKNATVVN